jgi:hypothetical protein
VRAFAAAVRGGFCLTKRVLDEVRHL